MKTKYVELTQEHIGQMVEVREANGEAWYERKLLAILPEYQCERFICEDLRASERFCAWQHGRFQIIYPATYIDRQEEKIENLVNEFVEKLKVMLM